MGLRFAAVRAVLLAVVASNLAVQAANANDSGCGLGAVIIQKNSQVLQLLSVTTNMSFLSQPFGITSGTSGCSSSGLVMNEKAIEYFAETNQSDLAREMAQGNGEKLSTLASLHECSEPGRRSFAHAAQKAFARIMPTADVSSHDMILKLQAELRADPDVARQCKSLASR